MDLPLQAIHLVFWKSITAVGEMFAMILIFLALKQMLHVINWDIVATLIMAAVESFQGLYEIKNLLLELSMLTACINRGMYNTVHSNPTIGS